MTKCAYYLVNEFLTVLSKREGVLTKLRVAHYMAKRKNSNGFDDAYCILFLSGRNNQLSPPLHYSCRRVAYYSEGRTN